MKQRVYIYGLTIFSLLGGSVKAMDVPKVIVAEDQASEVKEQLDYCKLAEFMKETAHKVSFEPFTQEQAVRLYELILMVNRNTDEQTKAKLFEKKGVPAFLGAIAFKFAILSEDEVVRFKLLIRDYLKPIYARNEHAVGIRKLGNYFKRRVLLVGGSEDVANKLAQLIWECGVTYVSLDYDLSMWECPFMTAYKKWYNGAIKDKASRFAKVAKSPVLSGFLPANSSYTVKGDKVSFRRSRDSNAYYIDWNGQMINEKDGKVATEGIYMRVSGLQ